MKNSELVSVMLLHLLVRKSALMTHESRAVCCRNVQALKHASERWSKLSIDEQAQLLVTSLADPSLSVRRVVLQVRLKPQMDRLPG